jgi:hypothetical protein
VWEAKAEASLIVLCRSYPATGTLQCPQEGKVVVMVGRGGGWAFPDSFPPPLPSFKGGLQGRGSEFPNGAMT